MLTIRGLTDGACQLTATMETAAVAVSLATADEMMARIGSPRDTVLSWARKALETREYAEDPAISNRLVGTLLWLACRGHPTAEGIEAGARQGGVLECDFIGNSECFYILTRSTGEKVGAAPGSPSVH